MTPGKSHPRAVPWVQNHLYFFYKKPASQRLFMYFNLAHTPKTVFGPGKISELPGVVKVFGHNALLITGGSSLQKSGALLEIRKNLFEHEVNTQHIKVDSEPTPDFVDHTADFYKDNLPDVVIAIGGGSVLDAGKAISAMLTQNVSVMDFLEGVGTGAVHNGHKIPFIAVPTTSGTGSEATKNAVLGKPGKNGFKRSLRHENFVPNAALIDPQLTLTCPAHITASCGMDTLTQLMESYLSTQATPFTDALCLDGLRHFVKSFEAVCTHSPNSIEHRSNMSYASFISGITLANTNLGTVHGFASSIAGMYTVPHGVICANLLESVMESSIEWLQQFQPEALVKFHTLNEIITGTQKLDKLIEKLNQWATQLPIPPLGNFGIQANAIPLICAQTNNKNNPAHLSGAHMAQILEKTLREN